MESNHFDEVEFQLARFLNLDPNVLHREAGLSKGTARISLKTSRLEVNIFSNLYLNLQALNDEKAARAIIKGNFRFKCFTIKTNKNKFSK